MCRKGQGTDLGPSFLKRLSRPPPARPPPRTEAGPWACPRVPRLQCHAMSTSGTRSHLRRCPQKPDVTTAIRIAEAESPYTACSTSGACQGEA